MAKTRKKMISEWNLYFKKEDGFEHREKVVDEVAHFLYDYHGEPRVLELDKVMLGGRISGHPGFHDGDLIFTSEVKRIEYVMIVDEMPPFAFNMYKATTKSGSEYYFDGNDIDPYGLLLMGDKLHVGWLINKPGRYMRKDLFEQHPELI